MGDKYTFVKETSNEQKVKIFLVTLAIVIGLGASVFAVIQFKGAEIESSSLYQGIKQFTVNEITEFTPFGIFLVGFAGALFFMPAPVEIPFYLSLAKGHPTLILLLVAVAGGTVGNVINYVVGVKFSKVAMVFVSKKKMYKARRWVSQYGGYVIFLLNVVPSPAPLLTFGLGLIKYNPLRLFVILITATVVKFGVIALIFHLFG